MVMFSPLDLDQRVTWHQNDLLREAEAERLVRQLPRAPRVHALAIRTRVSVFLRALADRLEPACCPPEAAQARGVRA
jgi:hypothetical protein